MVTKPKASKKFIFSSSDIDKIASAVLALSFSQKTEELDLSCSGDITFSGNLQVNQNLDHNFMDCLVSSASFPNAFVFEGEFDNGSRDIFYGNHLIAAVPEAVKMFMDDGQNASFLDVGIDWVEYFSAEKAVTVFSSSLPDSDGGEFCQEWIAHPEKGWMIAVSGWVGDYSDDDFDVNTTFKFWTGLRKEQINELVVDESRRSMMTVCADFAHTVHHLQNSIPVHLRNEVSGILLDEIKKSDVFRDLVATVTQQALGDNLGTEEKKVPRKNKASRKL